MTEVYVVKIDKYRMVLTADLLKSDVRVFSTKDKAIQFLIDNSFIYGKPPYFKKVAWYHSHCVNREIITHLIVANIEPMEIDEDKFLSIE